MSFYRFESNGKGIYEAVDLDCPRNDVRRNLKPDGSWLPRVGEKYPGAVSYWTNLGLQKYMSSGLQEWHRSVLSAPLIVQKCTEPTEILYKDDLQLICSPAPKTKELSWIDFAKIESGKPIINKVIIYVVHPRTKQILVMEHDPQFETAGIQVPTGTIDDGEAPLASAKRELFEESGLNQLSNFELIDEYLMFKHWNDVFNYRYVFQVVANEQLPEKWTHKVTGTGTDESLNFHYSWMDRDKAESCLNVSLGCSVRKIKI